MRARRLHRRGDGQAVLEMALVLPIMLSLVCLFVAIVLQVEATVRLQAALSLGTESVFAADVGDYRSACTDAATSFYGTVYGTRSLPAMNLGPCTARPPSSFTITPVGVSGFEQVQGFTCTSLGYLRGNHASPVSCTATVKLDYSQTPVGWAVFWSPTINLSTGLVEPPPARQCAAGVTCT